MEVELRRLKKEARQKSLDKRAGKDMRVFKTKHERIQTEIQDAQECFSNIIDNNDTYLNEEINYKFFKYTNKDLEDIQAFFDDACDNLIKVKHSPVWERHTMLRDSAMVCFITLLL